LSARPFAPFRYLVVPKRIFDCECTGNYFLISFAILFNLILPKTEMSTFLKDQVTTITEYNEALVRRLTEKVTVHEDNFAVEFKSGLTVDIED